MSAEDRYCKLATVAWSWRIIERDWRAIELGVVYLLNEVSWAVKHCCCCRCSCFVTQEDGQWRSS